MGELSKAMSGGFGSSNFAAAEAEAEARQVARQLPWRYYRKYGEDDSCITFLTDGDEFKLIAEHNLKLNGRWGNHFTCLSTVGEPCPLCQAGDQKYEVGFFLVLDHREYVVPEGKPNAGKVYKNQVRIFPAKMQTLQTLRKFYTKYGTLKGMTFEVSRSSAKAANVGDVFMPENADSPLSEEDMFELSGTEEGNFSDLLIDWEEALSPREVKELRGIARRLGQSFDDDDSVDVS